MASPQMNPGSCSVDYSLHKSVQSSIDEDVPSAQTIDQPQFDYDFVEQPSQDFFCPVTLELLHDPYQTTCCGNHLSKESAKMLQREGKPCPMCKEANLATVPDKFYKRKVYELQVRCPHKDNGCQWVGPLSDFNSHCSSCVKRPWACEHCNFETTYEVGVRDHLPNCEKYPEPCPNSCEVGTVERCNLKNHLLECPLRVVECEFREVGCSVRVPHRDLGKHMEESGQQHLMAMSLLNLRLTRELHQKMEEKDRQIAELNEQLKRQGTELRQQISDLERHLHDPSEEKTSGGLHQKLDDVRDKQVVELKEELQQHRRDIQEQISGVERQLQQEVRGVKARVDLALETANVFEFTITKFSEKKNQNVNWESDVFYTHPLGHAFTLAIVINASYLDGTYLSACLKQTSFLTAMVSGRLLLLNQLGDYGHHCVGFGGDIRPFHARLTSHLSSSLVPRKVDIDISQHFVPHSQLRRNAAKNTQYLNDDCLRFRLYLNIASR